MDKELIKRMAQEFKGIKLDRDVRIMEVCGTHTTEFFKTGVKDLFPDRLHLVDGPGCPVCVTSNRYLDRAIEIGRKYDPILATFGDMIKVPSSYSSLGKEKSAGMDIRVIYSPMEALDIARENPGREVIFLSVGFETTAPTEAIPVLEAKKQGLGNFSLLPGNKLTPPAVRALINLGESAIHGFILPGHVSAIIGANAWDFISGEFGAPTTIVGFEAHDLLQGTLALVKQIIEGKHENINLYRRAVKPEGNVHALRILDEVFEPSTAEWRGIGEIPGSGLALRSPFTDFDAVKKFPVTPPEPREPKGCRCGELLRGLITPYDCPHFGHGCVPEHPIGPCMVSTEGPCAAYFKYGRSK